MGIKKAALSDCSIVKKISETTILDVYPHYYPKGAVDFFLEHHSEENIKNDILKNQVFLWSDEDQDIAGTVTIKKNEICRLFVLPKYQGRGYGTELLNYAEKMIFKKYAEIILDASLPAKALYQKRGYQEKEFHVIETKEDDYLCYDVMIKHI